MRHLWTRDRVGSVNPTTQVNELTSIVAERECREIAELGDLVRLAANRAAPLDHVADPFDELDGLGDSLLAGVEEVSDAFDSDGLSAAALFL